MVKLGSLVRDHITGFEGVATGRVTYLYGCVHVQVSPTTLNDDGSTKKAEAFDEQRVVVTGTTELSDDFDAKYVDLEAVFPLGSKAKDVLTGFTGIVSAQMSALFGPDGISITNTKLNDAGEIPDANWFDVGRVQLLKPLKPVVSPDSSATSGSMTKFKAPVRSVRGPRR